MRPRSIAEGALAGTVAALPVVAVSMLGEHAAGLPNVPFSLFEGLTRVTPGVLLTTSIDLMVRVVRALDLGPTAAAAKIAETVLAVVLFVVGALVAGAAIGLFAGGSRRLRIGLCVAAGALLAAVALFAERAALGGARLDGKAAAWIVVLSLGWAALVEASFGAAAEPDRVARRQSLALLGGGAVAVTAAAFGVDRWLVRRRPGPPVARAALDELVARTSGPAASPPLAALAARPAPAPGTRPEITPNERFYRVDINLAPPRVDPTTWRLVVGGLVARPAALSLDAIRARPRVTQAITLECISNPVGGDLIGSSLWTGVRLRDLLRDLGARADFRAVTVHATDGFYESVSRADVLDPRTLLVFEMNGEPLLPEHGFPLRIYVPNRHGMKLPKWIRRIDVLDRDGPGFWVDRGWSADAIPHTTSVVDTVVPRDGPSGRVLAIGGIAYAGARGVRAVEVQIDDGPWTEARLLDPALGPLTWMLWRLEAPYRAGRRRVRVRAVDGAGAVQTEERAPPHPNGATGLHTVTVHV